MIMHVVVFAWKDGVDPADVNRLERDLHRLAYDADAFSFETGHDGAFRDEAADFVIVGKFADEAGLRRYLEHPDHHQILEDYARAMVARKESVQAVVGDAV